MTESRAIISRDPVDPALIVFSAYAIFINQSINIPTLFS
jgi:hypothetical protein